MPLIVPIPGLSRDVCGVSARLAGRSFVVDLGKRDPTRTGNLCERPLRALRGTIRGIPIMASFRRKVLEVFLFISIFRHEITILEVQRMPLRGFKGR